MMQKRFFLKVTVLPTLCKMIFHRTLNYPVYVLIITGLLFLSENRLEAEEWFTVRWVDDGDTIVLSDNRRIRYIGINAPEIKHENREAEPLGNEATAFNKNLVLRKKVRLEFDTEKYDRYGRFLAYIFLKDGTFVNKEMVKQGYAYCLPKKPNTRYQSKFLICQQKAMKAKTGIWESWKETETNYIGNKKSLRFHSDTCPFGQKTSRKNKKIFSRKWDAFSDGFAPCKKCMGKL